MSKDAAAANAPPEQTDHPELTTREAFDSEQAEQDDDNADAPEAVESSSDAAAEHDSGDDEGTHPGMDPHDTSQALATDVENSDSEVMHPSSVVVEAAASIDVRDLDEANEIQEQDEPKPGQQNETEQAKEPTPNNTAGAVPFDWKEWRTKRTSLAGNDHSVRWDAVVANQTSPTTRRSVTKRRNSKRKSKTMSDPVDTLVVVVVDDDDDRTPSSQKTDQRVASIGEAPFSWKKWARKQRKMAPQ